MILAAVAAVEWYERRHGGFEGVRGSVYFGRAVSLQLHLVIVPIGIWLGGVLVLGRVAERIFAHLPLPRRHRFGRPLRGLLTRSIRRRSWAAASAMIMVGLIVASRHERGSPSARRTTRQKRVTRGSWWARTYASRPPDQRSRASPSVRREAQGPGIQTATPVVYGLLNTLVESEVNEDAGNMAAIDPAAFGQVAPLIDTDFVGTTAASAMDALQRQPGGVFLEKEFADLLDVEAGDEVQVLFARATQDQKLSEMKVLGLFQRLPGSLEGVHALANIERQLELIPSTNATFFLAQYHRSERCHPGSASSPSCKPARFRGRAAIDTRATAPDRTSQASWHRISAACLPSILPSALAMATVAITIFVFGCRCSGVGVTVTLRLGTRIGRSVAAGHRILSVCITVGAAVGVLVGAVMA